MTRKMLINAAHPEESRVAVVCDGVLQELDIQIKAHESTLANIYKGVITSVEPSLQAAFVDYGGSRNGFLSINDVHPSYFPESFEESKRRPRIESLFKKGDEVVVQVSKEQRNSKGASLTTNVSLAGRYLVLMPGSDLRGVSRKIEDEVERGKLKSILSQLTTPEHLGFIIRTAGLGKTKTELSRDLNYLLRLWKSIEEKVTDLQAPALLYREHDVVIRSIRDHFTQDIKEILVDDKLVFRKAKEFFHEVMPRHEKLVKLYQEKRPLFNKYQLEEQVEQVYRKRINLKSGGYIVIEQTEAVVTIDVNSGGATKGKRVEDTAYKVNMEAAPEIARQLRLRDLGGIIIIDFIDMTNKKHKLDVERALKRELKLDRAKSKVLKISSLGVLELSRQRLNPSLGTGEFDDCPLCCGEGKLRSPEMTALSVFRRAKSMIIKTDVREVHVSAPLKVAEYLLNDMRSQLVDLERLHGGRLVIIPKDSVLDYEVEVAAVKEEIQAVKEEPIAIATNGQLSPVETPEREEASAEDGSPTNGDKRRSRRLPRRRKRPRKRPDQDNVEELSFENEGRDESTGESAPEEPETSIAAEGNAGLSTGDNGHTSENFEDERREGRESTKYSSLRRWLPFL